MEREEKRLKPSRLESKGTCSTQGVYNNCYALRIRTYIHKRLLYESTIWCNNDRELSFMLSFFRTKNKEDL